MSGGASSNGILAGGYVLSNIYLSLLIAQIFIVVGISHLLGFFMRPMRQPKVIAEIIAGILIGPSALGRIPGFTKTFFPPSSLGTLDSVAGMGLIFFLFLVGLELDINSLKKTGGVALTIATVGTVVPFGVGAAVTFFINATVGQENARMGVLVLFTGVAYAITAFPVLARILAERKLLITDVGQVCMSAAAVGDVAAWCLLALVVALINASASPLIALWTFFLGIAFVLLMFLIVRPCFSRLVGGAMEREEVSEAMVGLTLVTCLLAGFVTDLIGIHSIFGAFVFGLIIPKQGAFATAITEKIEDFVLTLMLPLYFASSGIKTQLSSVNSGKAFGVLVVVFVTACLSKVIAVTGAARLIGIRGRRALTLGVLMNTKGLVELIVLNIGYNKGIINQTVFTIMVLMALLTTFITSPVVAFLYRPQRDFQLPLTAAKKVEELLDSERIRAVACLFSVKSVPSMIHLAECIKGSIEGLLKMYAVHLMELSERPSAIMTVYKQLSKVTTRDPVAMAFDTYASLHQVSVRSLIVVSAAPEMHLDVLGLASKKRANLILLPYHKYHRVQGLLEPSMGFHQITHNILQDAPCAVAILVDRAFGGLQLPNEKFAHTMLVLFFGGPDDREALGLACRMGGHQGVTIKVLRFVHSTSTAVLAAQRSARAFNTLAATASKSAGSTPPRPPRALLSSPGPKPALPVPEEQPDSPVSSLGTPTGAEAVGGGLLGQPGHFSGSSDLPGSGPWLASAEANKSLSIGEAGGRAEIDIPEIGKVVGSNAGSPGSPGGPSFGVPADELDRNEELLKDEAALAKAFAAAKSDVSLGLPPRCQIEVCEVDNPLSAILQAHSFGDFDLVLVGRSQETVPMIRDITPPSTDGLDLLGVIGTELATSPDLMQCSILVVQQHDAARQRLLHARPHT